MAWRTARRFSDDNVTLIAGGLAIYALLSVFPALAAMVSIYGMFATPADIIKQMSAFAGVLRIENTRIADLFGKRSSHWA